MNGSAKPRPEATLRLQWPLGKTLAFALILLAGLAAVVETATRNPAIQSLLPAPSLGSGHANFDLKVARLNALVEKEGPVDCIFLGPSSVNRGIDPDIFEKAYKIRTGESLRCFNFGISGLNMTATAVLVKILTKIYEPKLLVLGTLPFVEEQGEGAEEKIFANPWVRYHSGIFSIDGWLMDYSRAYRYYLCFRIWLEQPGRFAKIKKLDCETTEKGYGFSRKIDKKIFSKPASKVQWNRKWYERLRDFQCSSRHLEALDRILQSRCRSQIVFVEVPVHKTFLSFYGGGPEEHDRFVSRIGERIKKYGVLFLPTTHLQLIPDDGWKNRNHMNYIGARVFSEWLGEKIGDAVDRGLIAAPSRKSRMAADIK